MACFAALHLIIARRTTSSCGSNSVARVPRIPKKLKSVPIPSRIPKKLKSVPIPSSRATGRRYRIQLEALDDESLREFQRLLRDLDHEKQMAVQQARLQPWRR